MMRRWRRARLALGALVLAACGGQSAGRRVPDGDAPRAAERADAPSDSDAEPAGAEPSRADVCADDTCFRCGAGFCMAGFFCDEDAAGGAACSWLPSCPARASCECVERALGAACRCQDSGGKVSVSCG